VTDQRHVAISVRRGRRLEQFELQAGTLRVGSAAHCDVRLAPDEAAAEQLLLTPHPRGLSVRALVTEPATHLDGARLSEALVDTTATLTIGAVSLTLQLLAPRERADEHSATLKTARRVALLIGLAALYYAVLHEPPAQSAFRVAVATPELFTLGQRECRYRERQAASVFAREQRAAADSKRERSPFNKRDGVLAVPLYDSAAACFRAAGELDSASEASSAAQRLAAQLQEELHAHHVLLEWFLGRARYAAAAQEVLLLRELVVGREDRYARWLSAVARELRTLTLLKGT
jgi:hypothetical protein